jgi:multidrug efflux pump subunit AcrB
VISLTALVSTIIILTVVLVQNSKFQLFPDFDTTQIYVYGKVDINNELEDTEELVTKIEKILLAKIDKENVSSVTSVIGMKMDAKNRAELGDNLFHIFVDLKERAPVNFFDTYIGPYLSIEYNPDVATRYKDAKVIAKEFEEYIKPLKSLKENDALVYEELVVKVPGAGVIASDVEISLSGKNDAQTIQARRCL